MFKALKRFDFFLKKKKDTFLVESDEDREFVIDSLINEKYIGLDTEFNWRKTYYPELSLLQISTESRILLIDCLKFKNLNFLNKILEKKDKIIIMHSCRSDTTVLNTNLKIKLDNIFDIQIAEKYLCGGEVKNYGTIVLNNFGYKLDKSETNSNWLKRPLSIKQLDYAANDVNFLIPIYKKQINKLAKIKKLDDVKSESKREATLGNQELHISRIKKLKKATSDEKALFLWREEQASIKNLPPSHIFQDKFLRKIAKEINNKNVSLEVVNKFFKNNSSANELLNYINS
ncbi:MAG: hypothetical protein CMQ53_00860 [Gammaproteobacteria bacterium]|nr:hypothetical protein [Gammaproteobacteria bacterium]